VQDACNEPKKPSKDCNPRRRRPQSRVGLEGHGFSHAVKAALFWMISFQSSKEALIKSGLPRAPCVPCGSCFLPTLNRSFSSASPPPSPEGSHSNTGSSPDRQSPRSFPCTKARGPRRHGKLLPARQPRIRIRFDHIHIAVRSQPHVDASVISQFQRAICGQRRVLQAFRRFVVQIFSDSRFRQLVSFGIFLEFHIVAGDLRSAFRQA